MAATPQPQSWPICVLMLLKSTSQSLTEHPRFQHDAMAANLALVEILNDVAVRADATNAQIALARLLAQHPWIVPIPGTKRVARLKENTGAATVQLTADQLDVIQAAADRISIVGARYPEHLDRLTNR